MANGTTGLHRGQPLLSAGVPVEQAQAAMIMVHGRGASAEDILSLSAEFEQQHFAYLAPQAANHAWYPYSFLQPIEKNEPWLSSALLVLEETLALVTSHMPPERVVLLGFSQGACLTLEFAARHARRYGGIAGLSGGLIGPDGTPRDYADSMDGTPIFLGCSDVDFHIPKERVQDTARVFTDLGAQVTMRLYSNMGHTVNEDEIEAVKSIMASVISSQ